MAKHKITGNTRRKYLISQLRENGYERLSYGISNKELVAILKQAIESPTELSIGIKSCYIARRRLVFKGGPPKDTNYLKQPRRATCYCRNPGKVKKKKTRWKGVKRYDGDVKGDAFLRSFEWRRVRYLALKENNGRCELCGRSVKDGIILNVDHVKPRRKHPELALDVKNLQVLCNSCNHGKGNIDDTDWREEQPVSNIISEETTTKTVLRKRLSPA